MLGQKEDDSLILWRKGIDIKGKVISSAVVNGGSAADLSQKGGDGTG